MICEWWSAPRLRVLFVVGLLVVGLGFGGPPAHGQTSITGTEVECEDGTAGQYPCENVDLSSFLSIADLGGSFGTNLNDVWGWTDPLTGTEWALVGRTDGVAFVDVTTPTEPTYVAELPTHSESSTWRDVKVYQQHAFVVSEAPGHGMQVFDLTQLRSVPPEDQPKTFAETAHYNEVESAHNVAISRETGFAYIVGGNGTGTTCGGGLHMVNIQDPTAPTFAGCFSESDGGQNPSRPSTFTGVQDFLAQEQATGPSDEGSTHDAQCTVYQGPDADHQGSEVCVNANGGVINIADVTDKDAPATIAEASYPDVGFVHQAWLTEDQRYLYVDDELDEVQGFVDQTRTIVFDVTDLDTPEFVTSYLGTTGAIDHNQYIDGDYSYQANYTSGLRILDASAPETPEEAAYFDTYSEGNPASFDGAWSTYPFFESNTVLISSIGEGLFVVQPELTTEAPVVRFVSDSSAVAEDGGAATLTVELAVSDPTAGIEVDVAFAADASTADIDDLETDPTQTVSFPASASAGDTQSVTVGLTDDSDPEGNEVARFDLMNLSTSGDASIGSPSRSARTILGDDRTVADARTAFEDGEPETVILEGTVSRAFGSYARLQDESGPTGASGLVIRQTEGPLSADFRADIDAGTIGPGTQLRVRGTISAFSGRLQLNNDNLTGYAVQGQGEPPALQAVSLSDLLAPSGEDYESELVRVEGLSFPDASGTFDAQATYTVEGEGGASFDVRVPDSSETGIIGAPIPEGVFTYRGVLGQFNNSQGPGVDEGYRLIPVRPADVQGEALTREVPIADGWNLLSVPLETDAPSFGATLPLCESGFFFEPGSGYAEIGGEEAVPVGRGLFGNCSAGTAQITGQAPDASTVAVAQGWNIIGPLADSVDATSITSTPPGIVATNFFGFGASSGYEVAPTLAPGRGYWVKAGESGTLNLSGGGEAAAPAAQALASSQAASNGPERPGVRLRLTDAAGRTATLRLTEALTETQRRQSALPPVPPGGVFDVRFRGGRSTAETTGDEVRAIETQGLSTPVTVTLAGAPERRSVQVQQAGTTTRLTAERPSATLASTSDLAVGLQSTPEEFGLEKASPNPASGPTTVAYALPESAAVTIAVYDVLGRRVATLADGSTEAGRHRAEFDAGRLQSGVYFVRLHADGRTQTKRLTVVR